MFIALIKCQIPLEKIFSRILYNKMFFNLWIELADKVANILVFCRNCLYMRHSVLCSVLTVADLSLSLPLCRVQMLLQLGSLLTGNLSVMNLLTIALCFSLLDDDYFSSSSDNKKKKKSRSMLLFNNQ